MSQYVLLGKDARPIGTQPAPGAASTTAEQPTILGTEEVPANGAAARGGGGDVAEIGDAESGPIRVNLSVLEKNFEPIHIDDAFFSLGSDRIVLRVPATQFAVTIYFKDVFDVQSFPDANQLILFTGVSSVRQYVMVCTDPSVVPMLTGVVESHLNRERMRSGVSSTATTAVRPTAAPNPLAKSKRGNSRFTLIPPHQRLTSNKGSGADAAASGLNDSGNAPLPADFSTVSSTPGRPSAPTTGVTSPAPRAPAGSTGDLRRQDTVNNNGSHRLAVPLDRAIPAGPRGSMPPQRRSPESSAWDAPPKTVVEEPPTSFEPSGPSVRFREPLHEAEADDSNQQDVPVDVPSPAAPLWLLQRRPGDLEERDRIYHQDMRAAPAAQQAPARYQTPPPSAAPTHAYQYPQPVAVATSAPAVTNRIPAAAPAQRSNGREEFTFDSVPPCMLRERRSASPTLYRGAEVDVVPVGAVAVAGSSQPVPQLGLRIPAPASSNVQQPPAQEPAPQQQQAGEQRQPKMRRSGSTRTPPRFHPVRGNSRQSLETGGNGESAGSPTSPRRGSLLAGLTQRIRNGAASPDSNSDPANRTQAAPAINPDGSAEPKLVRVPSSRPKAPANRPPAAGQNQSPPAAPANDAPASTTTGASSQPNQNQPETAEANKAASATTESSDKTNTTPAASSNVDPPSSTSSSAARRNSIIDRIASGEAEKPAPRTPSLRAPAPRVPGGDAEAPTPVHKPQEGAPPASQPAPLPPPVVPPGRRLTVAEDDAVDDDFLEAEDFSVVPLPSNADYSTAEQKDWMADQKKQRAQRQREERQQQLGRAMNRLQAVGAIQQGGRGGGERSPGRRGGRLVPDRSTSAGKRRPPAGTAPSQPAAPAPKPATSSKTEEPPRRSNTEPFTGRSDRHDEKEEQQQQQQRPAASGDLQRSNTEVATGRPRPSGPPRVPGLTRPPAAAGRDDANRTTTAVVQGGGDDPTQPKKRVVIVDRDKAAAARTKPAADPHHTGGGGGSRPLPPGHRPRTSQSAGDYAMY